MPKSQTRMLRKELHSIAPGAAPCLNDKGYLCDPRLPDSWWQKWIEVIQAAEGPLNKHIVADVIREFGHPRERLFAYLARRCLQNMTHSHGELSWALHAELTRGSIIFGVVWGCGGSSYEQEQPIDLGNDVGEMFWPCLMGGWGDDKIAPFYCPALGLQGAKPWKVHLSRVHIFEELNWFEGVQAEKELPLVVPAPPPPLPPPAPVLPADFDFAFDSSGHIYYFNVYDRVPTWVRPEHPMPILHDEAPRYTSTSDGPTLPPGSARGSHVDTGVDSVSPKQMQLRDIRRSIGIFDKASRAADFASAGSCGPGEARAKAFGADGSHGNEVGSGDGEPTLGSDVSNAGEPETEPRNRRGARSASSGPSAHSTSSSGASRLSDDNVAMLSSLVELPHLACRSALRNEDSDFARAVAALFADNDTVDDLRKEPSADDSQKDAGATEMDDGDSVGGDTVVFNSADLDPPDATAAFASAVAALFDDKVTVDDSQKEATVDDSRK